MTPSQVVRQLIREYIIEHAKEASLPAWLIDTAAKTRKTVKEASKGVR